MLLVDERVKTEAEMDKVSGLAILVCAAKSVPDMDLPLDSTPRSGNDADSVHQCRLTRVHARAQAAAGWACQDAGGDGQGRQAGHPGLCLQESAQHDVYTLKMALC